MPTLNLAAINAEFGAYCQEHKEELFLYNSLTLEKALSHWGVRIFDNVHQKLALFNAESADLIQPAPDCNFTPTDDVFKFDSRNLEVKPFKINIEVCPKEWHNTYMAHFRKMYANLGLEEVPFIEWMMKEIFKKGSYNLYQAFINGDTTSTNPVLKVCDGIIKILKDDAIANKIPTVTTGITTDANVIDQCEKMLDSLSAEYIMQGGKLFVSREVYNMYSRADQTSVGQVIMFNSLNGKGVNEPGSMPIYLRGSQIQLVMEPLFKADSVTGIEPMVLSIDGNFAVGTNYMDEYTHLEVQKFEYKYKLMANGLFGCNYILGSTNPTQKLLTVNDYFS